MVCARSFQAAVGCVNAERAALIWSRPSSGNDAVSVDETHVVGADASDRVTAWRLGSGEVAWSTERLLHRDLSAPASVGAGIVFGDVEGVVHLLARNDGRTLARLTTDGAPVIAQPARAGSTLLVVTRSGGLHAIRIE